MDSSNKNNEFAENRRKFIKGLEDPELLLTYHCNIACFFMDNLKTKHEDSNFYAHRLIERIFEPFKYDYIKLMKMEFLKTPEKKD